MAELYDAGPSHLPLLRGFACDGITGKYGVSEIQAQIRHGKPVRRTGLIPGHRFLLLFEGGEVVGCSYHEPHPGLSAQLARDARFLRFLALADGWQGRQLPSGRRASDVLLTATLDQIRLDAPTVRYVTGKVHVDNVRSIRLVERNGFEFYHAHPRYPVYAAVL